MSRVHILLLINVLVLVAKGFDRVPEKACIVAVPTIYASIQG
jgi:hypothetical protein